MFVQEHVDGAGHRMMNILNGIAFATGRRVNFGGIIAVPNTVTEQGSDFREIVDSFFGEGASLQLFFRSNKTKTRHPPYFKVKHHPEFAHIFRTLQNFTNWRPQLEEKSNVFLPSTTGVSVKEFYTEEVRAEVTRLLYTRPLRLYTMGKAIVAVHIRRGDLHRDDKRATPDEYYYKLLDKVKKVVPKAEFHIFSSTKNIQAFKDEPYWFSKDFDGYRERGMMVHLDDDSLLVPWVHLSRAHVFVLSKSSFSYVPAVLSSNCVVHPGDKSAVPENWINGDEVPGERAKFGERLGKCIAGLRDRNVLAE